MTKRNKREIVVLSQEEHILLRPEMYIGSVIPTEEKVPIIKNNKIIQQTKDISIGMHKLLDEAIDNAFDEAKRCADMNKPMKRITVTIDTKRNLASVQDTGLGFYKGLQINEKSGKNNIETAFSQLHAGSNFDNDDVETTLIGTNGVGISCTNVLSEYFSVVTSDGRYLYKQVWENFKTTTQETVTSLEGKKIRGTKVSFIPRKSIFSNGWDIDYIYAKMVFRNFLIKHDPPFEHTQLKFIVDGEELDLDITFLEKNSMELKGNTKVRVFSWPTYENSINVSFVNGSMCSGIHQKIIQEVINDSIFDYDKAHYIYDTFVIINMPPKNVKFSDQNKTKFVANRYDVTDYMNFYFTDKEIASIKNSSYYKVVHDEIENTLKKEEISKLKKARKVQRAKISDKYFSAIKKENLFIVEGNSARGSILQKRDSNIDSIYTLKGKIKNIKSISDLSSNQEILDLMNILDLNIDDGGSSCKFKKIIISCDADFDGFHIASLLINFFNKWFPDVVKSGKLYQLICPLVSVDVKNKRKYFYSLDEFSKHKNHSNVRYLKGLGSNDIKDWEYIFSNLSLEKIVLDEKSDSSLNMAFGNNSQLRKNFLMGI